MPIPLALTTITVERLTDDPDDDGADETLPLITVASGVRATVDTPSARTSLSGGVRTVTTWRMQSDVCDMRPADVITDAAGNTYVVQSATVRRGLGLDHISAVLTDVEGAS